ncbi:MAG TPA: phosphatase [Lacunisphaera sp.]
MKSVANNPSVAVIDIGSNSIKVLIAARDAAGNVASLHSRTIDARISAGISSADPQLGSEGMARGLTAIQELLMDAAPFKPARTVLVATSAVRDAGNGAEFRAKVKTAVGHDIRILSGDEEANLIGRGLTSDPALAALQDFYVFDLGGGSLECLAFQGRRVQQAVSLPLGCVRLTEKFVPNPSAPFAAETMEKIAKHTHIALARSGFLFALPDAVAVGTGGTVATVRAILGARTRLRAEQTAPVVNVADLRGLLDQLSPLSLEQRQRIPGMPAARADVFPAALTTFLVLAALGGLSSFHHSFYNLRWGLAADALEHL